MSFNIQTSNTCSHRSAEQIQKPCYRLRAEDEAQTRDP